MIFVIEVASGRKWIPSGNLYPTLKAARDRIAWLEKRDDEMNRTVARRIGIHTRVGTWRGSLKP